MSNKIRLMLATVLVGGTLGAVGVGSAATAAPLRNGADLVAPAPSGVEPVRWGPHCRTAYVRGFRHGRPVMLPRRICR